MNNKSINRFLCYLWQMEKLQQQQQTGHLEGFLDIKLINDCLINIFKYLKDEAASTTLPKFKMKMKMKVIHAPTALHQFQVLTGQIEADETTMRDESYSMDMRHREEREGEIRLTEINDEIDCDAFSEN